MNGKKKEKIGKETGGGCEGQSVHLWVWRHHRQEVHQEGNYLCRCSLNLNIYSLRKRPICVHIMTKYEHVLDVF